ncbi:hypothetical protein IDSA_07220 [Pseudidiomarina salinarum]|uniref:Lipoprotein n=1 Tax=Pseudidiomarina salinarum TaxID=435908 RepID=A0A094JE98_9GAMM|nr:hypothetical protein [Pseudidiomarina salinarum]KFZ30861.1 hypothetical protein IDSA_07220 [Pseudidiomarina salinarum]RUO71338.1 hypothetical protein CWI79_07900 [Pseudidiomarina salinarum]
MKLTLKAFSFVLLTVVFLAGCRSTAPIMQVKDTVVSNSLNKEDVRTAIIEAASKRGWVISEPSEDELHATLNIRTHQAIVRIPYSADSYSIIYVDSSNLDKKNNRIHPSYNSWVTNLNNDINALLQIERLSR